MMRFAVVVGRAVVARAPAIACVVVATVALVALPPNGEATAPAPKATFSQAEIYQSAMDRRRAIRNLRVEYDVSFKKLLDLPTHGGENGLSLDPYRVRFAMDGERRRLHVEPISAKEVQSPRQQRPPTTVIFDGERSIEFSPTSIAMLTSGKNRRCEIGELYAEVALGIAITDGDRATYDNSWFYPHCLRAAPRDANAQYHVLPDLELVDSFWCHVLVADGYDKLWIDPCIGFAYRRRDLYYGPQDKALAHRDTLSEFIESGGIWVPTRWHRETFAELYNPKEYWNKAYAEASLAVRKIGVNQATEEDFKATLPAGSYVTDMSTHMTYQVPGDGFDAMRDLAERGRRYLVDAPGAQQQGLGGPVRAIAVAVSVVAIGVMAVWSYFRSRPRSA